MAEIYYTSTITDENGHKWYYINGDTGYDLTSGWTKEEADEHYLSDDGIIERDISARKAYGFYD